MASEFNPRNHLVTALVGDTLVGALGACLGRRRQASRGTGTVPTDSLSLNTRRWECDSAVHETTYCASTALEQ